MNPLIVNQKEGRRQNQKIGDLHLRTGIKSRLTRQFRPVQDLIADQNFIGHIIPVICKASNRLLTVFLYDPVDDLPEFLLQLLSFLIRNGSCHPQCHLPGCTTQLFPLIQISGICNNFGIFCSIFHIVNIKLIPSCEIQLRQFPVDLF